MGRVRVAVADVGQYARGNPFPSFLPLNTFKHEKQKQKQVRIYFI
jgi:hypothetical protein